MPKEDEVTRRSKATPRTAETDIERRLREAGSDFIKSHRQTEEAIREAVCAGMPPGAIGQVSSLSQPTVNAFVRQLVQTPKLEVHEQRQP